MTSNAFLVTGAPGDRAPTADSGDRTSTGDGNSDDRTSTGDHGRRVLVDCGANYDAVAAVREHVETLDAVVLTHTHPDHVGTLPALREAFGVETLGFDPDHDEVDTELPDGGTVEMGTATFEARYTPGHKDDHLCLFDRESGVLFAGDLVFADGAFGRTDLAEGDRETLIDSIDRLREWVGDDVTAVYTGHGPPIETEPAASLELSARAAKF